MYSQNQYANYIALLYFFHYPDRNIRIIRDNCICPGLYKFPHVFLIIYSPYMRFEIPAMRLFDIFFILMTVVPPSDHLFVIFIFDDAVFSHGRSGSVSGNVVDAIINIIVTIVFFFLFSVDIKAVYKFIIESLFKIMKMFELLFRKKIKDLIHPCLSEFFIGNKRKVLHFIFFGIKSFFTNKAVDMGIPFQISAKSM